MYAGMIMLVAALSAGPFISDVELVTVTDSGFAISFVTAGESEATVLYGTDRDNLEGRANSGPGKFHHIEVDALLPGTEYYYRVESGESGWPSRLLSAKRVRTLTPPPGEHLFTFAVMNDIHVGEDVAGLITLPLPGTPTLTPGFDWPDEDDQYWDFTLRATVEEINASEAELAVVNGDLTADFLPEQFQLAKEMLDRLEAPYYVVRGNHDRVEKFPEDYFEKTFGLDESWYSFDQGGVHFTVLDDSRLADGWHGFPKEEWEWLERELESHRDVPVIIFSHRPIGASWSDVNKKIRKRMLALFSQHPQIIAVFNAHSHRANIVTVPDYTGDTPYFEVPSVKEYPTGYALIEVYEGGLMYNFHLTDCDKCLEWNNTTRGQYFGTAPRRMMRKVEHRNSAYEFPPEKSALVEAAAR